MTPHDHHTLKLSALDAATRARHTGAAIRGFLGVSRDWQLTEPQQLLLLGDTISPGMLATWKIAGDGPTLEGDALARISLLLGIYKGLERFFRGAPDASLRWLHTCRQEVPFDGAAPLHLMLTHGTAGLAETRQYIENAAGGAPLRVS